MEEAAKNVSPEERHIATSVPIYASFLPNNLEALTKFLASVAVFVYACGFAIVTIFNGSRGIPDLSPVKPRFAFAGTIFLLLTFVPTACTFPILRSLYRRDAPRRFAATWILSYVWLSGVLASASAFLFHLDTSTNARHHTWVTVTTTIFSIAISAMSYFYQDAERASKLKRFYLLYLLAAADVGLVLYNGIPRADEFTFSQLILWFFAAGVVGGLALNEVLDRERRQKVNWPYAVFYLIYLLSIYPTFVFPHIRSAFAGGFPRKAQIVLNKESVFPCKVLNLGIVQDEETGIYAENAEHHVLFVPRGSVALIQYGDSLNMVSLPACK